MTEERPPETDSQPFPVAPPGAVSATLGYAEQQDDPTPGALDRGSSPAPQSVWELDAEWNTPRPVAPAPRRSLLAWMWAALVLVSIASFAAHYFAVVRPTEAALQSETARSAALEDRLAASATENAQISAELEETAEALSSSNAALSSTQEELHALRVRHEGSDGEALDEAEAAIAALLEDEDHLGTLRREGGHFEITVPGAFPGGAAELESPRAATLGALAPILRRVTSRTISVETGAPARRPPPRSGFSDRWQLASARASAALAALRAGGMPARRLQAVALPATAEAESVTLKLTLPPD